jgi:hypothetical protein
MSLRMTLQNQTVLSEHISHFLEDLYNLQIMKSTIFWVVTPCSLVEYTALIFKV